MKSTTEGFYTPPPTKNYYGPTTTTQPKLRTCRTDIRHKVPAGDSPYVRAKHVQLVDKNPGKAVSLFWAAINSGDRVDSALKDMAVVMKQLDRSDEAIEAIKSFRTLCLPESQDSLDNVLVELYKRSGRIEEEIQILQHKLKRIQEGAAFGGKRSKIGRCQGRRVQVTVQQETARILGNLAWAYLQLGQYAIAEDKYRKGLSLDPDKNMQCNLAYCLLLQTHKIEEAKYLLDTVKTSSEDGYVDESYIKSYERAFSKLADLEHEVKVKGSLTATPRNCSYPQNQWNTGRPFQRKMNSDSRKHENRSFIDATAENVANSSPVLLTQPRSPWRLTNPDQRKKLWNGRVVGNSSRKLSFEQPKIEGNQADSDYQICNRTPPPQLDGRKGLDWRAKALKALPHSDIIGHHVVDKNLSGIAVDDGEKSVITNGNPSLSWQNETESQKVSDHAEDDINRKNNAGYQEPSAEPLMLPSQYSKKSPLMLPSQYSKKSWADMVEEEELFAGLETLNKENVNPSLCCPAPCKMMQETEDRTSSFVS